MSKRTSQAAELISMLDYTLSKKRDNNSEHYSVAKAFKRAYKKSSVPDYITFTTTGESGIPKFVAIFEKFDPINTIVIHPVFENYRSAKINEFHHVYQYLSAPKFNRDLLIYRNYDDVVNAIISFMLMWNDESLRLFAQKYPKFKSITNELIDEKHKDNGIFVYNFNGMPYIKTAIKIIRKQFQFTSMRRKSFQLVDHLNMTFVKHLKHVYNMLINEDATTNDIDLLESDMPVPFDLETSIGSYVDIKDRARIKFITGQACSGKTTLLNSLKKKGWKIVSRGDVGSFSGKTDNPVAVACLHGSIEWALNHSDVLGDRSNIDNALWVGIMQMCDPKYGDNLIQEILKFINSNFNEPSIAYFMGQKGVVFIDVYPSYCSQRMLKRSTDGDPYRGRLQQYSIVQAMAYYTIARLFGWKIYCVPYTKNQQFNPSAYKLIANDLELYFGHPNDSYPLPQQQYDKPSNNFVINNNFAKSVGIYK